MSPAQGLPAGCRLSERPPTLGSRRPAGHQPSPPRGQSTMPGETPRPTDDPWRDADGAHISLFCWVEQVAEHPEEGVLFSRLHERGQVLGGGHNLLYVRFDGEGHLVGVSPQLVRLLPEPPDAEHGIDGS